MKFNPFIYTLLLLLLGTTVQAQDALGAEDFWQQVRRQHPLARQAALLREMGQQELLQARAAFDPKFYAQHDQKTFGGKEYYEIGEGGLKIPTRLAGIEFKAGYDWTDPSGLYINPERNIPPAGQAILGFSIPLLRGLFTDEARADFRQARIGQDLYLALARDLENELYASALSAYWNWAYAHYAQDIAIEALRYSEERMSGIVAAFVAGDNPAIDTLEAFLQVQSWSLELQDATVALAQSQANLQALLWEDEAPTRTWNPVWSPQNPRQFGDLPAYADLEQLLLQHPALRGYDFKAQQLAEERRWKVEQFKPQLTLDYNLLANRLDFTPEQGGEISNLVADNYKFGIRFEQPLFLRKARSGVALTDIKIAQNDWKRQQKQQDLQTKLDAYWQTWELRSQQSFAADQLVENYARLLEAERTKFELGESSVFLLNSRLQKLLSARLKRLKLQVERQKAAYMLQYLANAW
ncbi:MAG: TolC family protein [Bacteroidota bacterium]